MEEERVKQLAETLKKQGLAASMYEAMEKAKSILNIKSQNNQKRETTKEIPKPEENPDIDSEQQEFPDTDEPLEEENKFSKPDYDIAKETASLNELMQEIGVTPEQVAEQEKQKIGHITEEVHEIREELRETEQAPEKIEEIREEISHVGEEIDELIRGRDENPEPSQEMETEGYSEPEKAQDESKEEKTKQPSREEVRSEDDKKIDLGKIFNYKKQ